MFLPSSDPAAGPDASWTPYDTRWTTLSATTDGSGGATVALPVVPDNERWQVDRITVSATGGRGTTFRLYAGDVDARNLIDGTDAGDFDVCDAASPIEVQPGVVLTGQWTGGVVSGLVCTMRIHYLIERQAGDGLS